MTHSTNNDESHSQTLWTCEAQRVDTGSVSSNPLTWCSYSKIYAHMVILKMACDEFNFGQMPDQLALALSQFIVIRSWPGPHHAGIFTFIRQLKTILNSEAAIFEDTLMRNRKIPLQPWPKHRLQYTQQKAHGHIRALQQCRKFGSCWDEQSSKNCSSCMSCYPKGLCRN